MAKPPELAIPDQTRPKKDGFNIRPKKVEQWLENLPRANLGETARLIYTALNEVNQTSYAYHDRVRFLETMREPVQYLADSLKKHFIGVSYPLPVKNQKIAAATRELLAAMAIGYKITINDMLGKAQLFIDKKLLTTLLHRALVYTGRTLLTSYQIYAPCAPDLWQELHKLFTLAESRHLENTAIADYQLLYSKKSTIQAEYTRILLLALTSPYRLRQGEVSKVYSILEHWTKYCNLSQVNEYKNKKDGYFAVRLNRDAPPQSIALLSSSKCDTQQCRIINTEALSEHIRNAIQDTDELGTSTFINGIELSRPDLSHDLLRRLLVAWGIETKRGYSRTQKQEHVDVTIGLSATHQFICQSNQTKDNSFNTLFRNNQAQFESTIIENINDERPDLWNMVYPQELHGFRPLLENEINHAAHDASPYIEETWAIINESAGGYCLEYQTGKSAKAQVGELVGIRRKQRSKSQWTIGVIRWLKFSNTRSLHLGIEMLNPEVAAIGMRAASNHDKTYQRTLMLPEIPAIRQPNTLITAPSPWRVGNQVIINILGKEKRIQLTAASQCTGLFSQFQFILLDQHKDDDDRSDTSKSWEVDKDFSKIWSSM